MDCDFPNLDSPFQYCRKYSSTVKQRVEEHEANFTAMESSTFQTS